MKLANHDSYALVFCFACILTISVEYVLGDVLASGQLQSCVRDGTLGASQQLNCTQKMIVTLTVPNGATISTQELDFSLPCVGSLDGQCPCTCDYSITPSCTCRDLATPLRVSLKKTSLLASYPLQYLQSFNYKPIEVIVRPGPGNCKCLKVTNASHFLNPISIFSIHTNNITSSEFYILNAANNTAASEYHLLSLSSDDGCSGNETLEVPADGITPLAVNITTPNTSDAAYLSSAADAITAARDGGSDTDPTCGWYYQGGVQVPDSQGFCCRCSSAQIYDSTFGTGDPQRTRANLDCDFFSNPLDILIGKLPTSAHCLQFDPQWYSGYKLGSSSVQFDITISVTVPTSSALTLQKTANSSNYIGTPILSNVTQHLVISPSVPLAVSAGGQVSVTLEGDLAMYTALPVLSSQVLLMPQPVSADQSKWMLLDQSLMSLDGTACNMVGTSFAAFRYQADGCTRAPQVCLSSQIKDLYTADLRRVAKGKVPLYLTTQFTQGAQSQLKAFHGGPLSFVLPVTSQSNSIVLLSTTADHLALVTNASPGIITVAQICQFSNLVCGGFEAGASRGFLHVSVANQGTLDASYTLTVSNCTANIRPVEATMLSVPAGATAILAPPLQIYVEDNLASASRYCWTTLYNSLGIVTSQRQFFFYTNATVLDLTPTGGYNGTGSGDGTAKANKNCDEVCSNSFDIACFVLHGCWGKIGKFSGLLSGLVAGTLLLGLAAKMGLLSSCAAHMHTACCAGRALSALGGGASTASKPPPPSSCFGSGVREEEGAAVVGGTLGAAAVMSSAQKARVQREGRDDRGDDSDGDWDRTRKQRVVTGAAKGKLAGSRGRQYSAHNSAYEDSDDGFSERDGGSAERGDGDRYVGVAKGRSKDSDKVISEAHEEHLHSGSGRREPRSRGGYKGRLSGLLQLERAGARGSPRGPPELLGAGRDRERITKAGGIGRFNDRADPGSRNGGYLGEDMQGSRRPGKRRAMTAPEPAAQMSSKEAHHASKPRMMSAPAAAATAQHESYLNGSSLLREQPPSHRLADSVYPLASSSPHRPRGYARSPPVSPTRVGGQLHGGSYEESPSRGQRHAGQVRGAPTHQGHTQQQFGNPLYEQGRG